MSHVWIVDGILGLGGRSDIPGTSMLGMALREASTLPNKTVVAVDVPTGLDVDDSSQTKVWLKADITVTFGERKPALVLSPARDLSGEVITRDVGFPRQAVEDGLREHPALWLVPDEDALLGINPWQKLGPSTHKYDRGHVLIIGGSLGKTGAPLLSALSALRTGAGWATVAMAQDVMDSLRGDVPREIVFEDLFDPKDSSKHLLDAKKLQDFVGRGRVRSIVIGPGTMGSPLTTDALAVIGEFCSSGGFAVFDAGACHGLIPLLNTLPQPTSSIRRWVMTPHPGEWAKLGLDDSSPPLKPSLWIKTQSLAAKMGMPMLYKSATPALFLGDGKGPALVSTAGSKILARAGSGDILAGAIAAHGAQGLDVATSVMRSQILLAQAAHRAAQRLGDDAVLAHDVLEDLGRVLPRYGTS
jgi:NAD(P)H-hydrate epimerase